MNSKYFDAIWSGSNNKFPVWAEQGTIVIDPTMQTRFETYIDGDTRWIVFRPTTTLLNWIWNFIFPLRRYPYDNKKSRIRIHTGFFRGYTGFLRGALHQIMIADRGRYKYITTGHSLGGVFARTAAVDMVYNFGCSVKVRTFGAPNLGNRAFEESYKRRVPDSVDYAVKGDPVCWVPFRIFGYSIVKRIKLPRRFNWKVWLNHGFQIYIDGLQGREVE